MIVALAVLAAQPITVFRLADPPRHAACAHHETNCRIRECYYRGVRPGKWYIPVDVSVPTSLEAIQRLQGIVDKCSLGATDLVIHTDGMADLHIADADLAPGQIQCVRATELGKSLREDESTPSK